ncbi:MAG: nucleoside permease [Planctomycetes bacterium]|nr:nucleoside permease [Planctomycetota bacterium]
MSMSVRIKLSVMMFLQYAMYGIWVIPMGAYLNSVGFSGKAIGWAYSASAIACLIAPFFIGMIADRFFSAQKVLGILNILAAGLLLVCMKSATNTEGEPQPVIFFIAMLGHTLCYMPTWALTNSIAMAHMTRPDKQFPGIRVLGTIGWVVVSAVGLLSALGKLDQFAGVGFLNELAGKNIEVTSWPMLIGAYIGIAAGIFSFFLPKTPPKSIDHKITVADILGLKALQLLKEPCFAIFVLCSFLITFAGAFYWSFCNMFLNEMEWPYAQFKMSIGQMSEVVFMLIMPFFFRKLGVKKMLLLGMAAWIARFILFAFGNIDNLVFMFYLGVALHGICYDFFFVTGQIYTDKKAPKEIQASAQGFISFITFGVGMLLGNTLAGFAVDKFKVVSDDIGAAAAMHNWQMIWIIPSCIAGVIFVLFAFTFHDKEHDKFEEEKAEQA